MIIDVNNIVLEGIHGLTEKEQKIPQKFKVDVKIELWSNASVADNIDNTFDYRKIKSIIHDTIKGKSCRLIETLAEQIVSQIIQNQNIFRVVVVVSKIDIWGNGFPSVTLTRCNTNFSGLFDFDANYLIRGLLYEGAVSIPIVPEARRLLLIDEAMKYPYTKQPEIVGPAKVREQLSSFDKFPKDSLFIKLRDDFTQLLNYKLSFASTKPFSEQISFNELSLQKYDEGSIGITPHKDNFSSINLIAIFILKGKGDFAICDDRQGINPRYLDTTVGNVIFMRAPKFFSSNYRPFHFVSNITEERLTLGLRYNLI
mgnify:CR=1 FL=1